MRTLLVGGLCLVLGLYAGASLGSAQAGPPEGGEPEAKPIRPAVEPVGDPAPGFSRYHKLDRFARALALIEQYYVRPVDGDRLIDAALTGLVAELDPHTNYLPPADARLLMEDTSGRFGGVGLIVSLALEPQPAAPTEPSAEPAQGGPAAGAEQAAVVLVIDDVIPGGPAERAGLVVGDRILAIEDKPIANFGDLQDAIELMRGEPGTEVRFTFAHADQPPRTIRVTRAIVDPPAVELRWLGEGLGVLRLRDFQDLSAREVEAGLAELRERASKEGVALAGVVLDLRGNGGGLLDQAIEIVDLFVAEGVIVRTRGRQGKLLAEDRARAIGTERDLPLVVLMNKGSASASEVVAGALQDHRRALIIGERSYGKGSVQQTFDLDASRDGAMLKLTTALYYTPDDRLIQASGIEPDVVVGRERAKLTDSLPGLEPERALPYHLEPEDFGRASLPEQAVSPAREAAGEDAQLLAAIDHLQAWARLGGPNKRRR